MILNPAAKVRVLSRDFDHCTCRAHSNIHPSGAVHWVPEQLNIRDVTGACELADGCSHALCSATVSVVSAGICHRNKVNTIA